MAHRIRHAHRDTIFAEKLSGTIEADEIAVVSVSKGKGGFSGKNSMNGLLTLLMISISLNAF